MESPPIAAPAPIALAVPLSPQVVISSFPHRVCKALFTNGSMLGSGIAWQTLLGLNTRSDAAPQLEFDQRRTDQAADEHQQKVCRQPHSVDTSPLKVQVHNIAGGPSPRCWYAMPYGRQQNSSWGASLDGIDVTGSVGASSSSIPGNGMFSKPGQAAIRTDASFSIRTSTPSSGPSDGYDAGLPPGERLLRR